MKEIQKVMVMTMISMMGEVMLVISRPDYKKNK